MMRLPAGELATRVAPLLRDAGLWRDGFDVPIAPWLERVIELLKPRAKRLGQFVDDGRLFFVEDVELRPGGRERSSCSAAGMPEHLAALRRALDAVAPFDAAALEAALRALAAARGIKPAALIHATRVAVTGKAASPGLFEVLELLGRRAHHPAAGDRLEPRRGVTE